MTKDIFNFDKGRKSIVTDNLLKSYGIDQSSQQTIEKSDDSTTGDPLEKGGKRAVIGEKREFSGRMYIKTATGWKFFGKGTGSKAQDHHSSATSHDSKKDKFDFRKTVDMINDDGHGRAYLKTQTTEKLNSIKQNISNIPDSHPASIKTSQGSQNYSKWIDEELQSRKHN